MKKSPFFPLLIPAEVWDVPPLLGRARVYIANLLQAFSSLFFGIYAAMSSHLTARVPQIWEAAIPFPSLVCCFIQRAFLHPAQSLIPTFSCAHALTASTESNQIAREVSVWAYQQSQESVCCCILSQLPVKFVRFVPPHLQQWSHGAFCWSYFRVTVSLQ